MIQLTNAIWYNSLIYDDDLAVYDLWGGYD